MMREEDNAEQRVSWSLAKYTLPTPANREYTVCPFSELQHIPWYQRLLTGSLSSSTENQVEEKPVKQPSPQVIDLLERAGSEPDVTAVQHWTSDESIVFEQALDETAVAFTKTLASVSRLFQDFLYNSRYALDLLTFPTSYSYEPLSRLRGTFYLISLTYRTIKRIEASEDRISFRTYIREEMKEFKNQNTAFYKGCSKLMSKFRYSYATLNTKLSLMRKIQKQLKLEILTEKGGSSRIYTGPIYCTDQDPRELRYYETVVSGDKDEDLDELSINLIWTNKTLFYKVFQSSNWYDLHDLTPRHQMRLLISLTEQVRAIFFQAQSKLEKGIEKFIRKCSKIVTLLNPFHVSLAKATEATVSSDIRFRVQSDIQKLEILRCKVKQMLDTLDNNFKWIKSVTRDVVAMAPMNQDETKEYLFKFSYCSDNPMYKSVCCVRPIDCFFTCNYETLHLRVCITPELMDLLIESTPPSYKNEDVSKIMVKMAARDIEEYKFQRTNEYEFMQRTMSAPGSEHTLPMFETGFMTRMKTRDGNQYINVFTVGHTVRVK